MRPGTRVLVVHQNRMAPAIVVGRSRPNLIVAESFHPHTIEAAARCVRIGDGPVVPTMRMLALFGPRPLRWIAQIALYLKGTPL